MSDDELFEMEIGIQVAFGYAEALSKHLERKAKNSKQRMAAKSMMREIGVSRRDFVDILEELRQFRMKGGAE